MVNKQAEKAKANGIDPYEYLLLVFTLLTWVNPKIGKANALAPDSPAPGIYTKVNDERQDPMTGILP